MIETDSLSFGKNMVWFVGVVEDRIDPNFLGRVRVRCFGFHSEDRDEIPTEALPWAMVMQPITSAAQTDVGQSPTGLVDGSWVVGMFLDGEEAQQPLVVGSLGGYARKPEKLNPSDHEDWADYGFKDVREGANLQRRGFPQPPVNVRRNRGDTLGATIEEDDFVSRYPRVGEEDSSTTPKLARGINDLTIRYDPEVSATSSFEQTKAAYKEPMLSKMLNVNRNIPTAVPSYKFDQPQTPYKAVYPFNHVTQTESGHIVEYDDTPNAERIHEYHRSGTFREVYPDGTLVKQTMSDQYDFTEAHSYEYTKGAKYSTHRRGVALMVNSARLAGENYEVKVCGSSNHNLIVEDGDYNVKVQTGKIDMIASSMQHRGINEIIQTAPLIHTNVGNHLHRIQNDYTGEARGAYNINGGSVEITSAMNTNMAAGDNWTCSAGHTISMTAENSFAMLPFYAPEPVAVSHVARHGHIELNAQDGDTRISSRTATGGLLGIMGDKGSFTVTSPLRTSIASIFQMQPSPEWETHMSHPSSLVGQTQTGYIYLVSKFGNIVLETQTFNSIKIKATPVGTVETQGGYIQTVSTSTHILSSSRLNTYIKAGMGLYTNSFIGTQIYSGMEVFIKAATSIDLHAQFTGSFHVGTPRQPDGRLALGDYTAHSPALRGDEFMKMFLNHFHLTPLGPTSTVSTSGDPSIVMGVMKSFCQKTFVF